MILLLRKQGKTYGRINAEAEGPALAQRLNPKSSPIWFDNTRAAAKALLAHFLKDEEPLR